MGAKPLTLGALPQESELDLSAGVGAFHQWIQLERRAVMSPSEYEQLVEVLGRRFAAIGRRFDRVDQQFVEVRESIEELRAQCSSSSMPSTDT